MNFILILFYFTDEAVLNKYGKFVFSHINLIYFEIYAVLLVDGVLLFLKSGYEHTWMGELYKGTSIISHGAAYLMNGILVLLLLMQFHKPSVINLGLTIIPVIAIFKSGARAALIPTLIIGYLFVDLLSNGTKKKKVIRIIKSTLIIFFIILILFLFFKDTILSSSVFRKTFMRSQVGDSSAGRSIFWKTLLNRYVNNRSIVNILIGHGDDTVYYYNLLDVGTRIWAHNDFIQALVGKGIVGLLVYVSVIIIAINKYVKIAGGFSTVIAFVFILSLAFVNGYYPYDMSVIFTTGIFLYLYKITYLRKQTNNLLIWEKMIGNNLSGK